MLLGLTGCGDNNQSDTTQTGTQASTLQKVESSPAIVNYSLAASPITLGAVAPLQGWNVTKSTALGASTLIDAAKDTKISAALITPNAKQVAEVLRGGAAGIALSIAVDQLVDAIDWVMDPANNSIKYYVENLDTDNCSSTYRFYASSSSLRTATRSCEIEPVVMKALVESGSICINGGKFTGKISFQGTDSTTYKKYSAEIQQGTRTCGIYFYEFFPLTNPVRTEKQLSLEAVAEQVITNADVGSLDAQVATNIAAQNILNDVVQAEPVVQELENNASEKCDENTNLSCKKECDPPAGVKFNKVTHFERHGRDPDINVGSHGCMAKTGSPVHWHYDVNHQLPDGRCFLKGHNFGGCGVAP